MPVGVGDSLGITVAVESADDVADGGVDPAGEETLQPVKITIAERTVTAAPQPRRKLFVIW